MNIIRIFGKPFEIVYKDHVENGSELLGQCLYYENEIQIRTNQKPAEELDTVIHELLHALVRTLGLPFQDENHEEMVVSRLGAALAGTFLDNPELIQFIDSKCKESNAYIGNSGRVSRSHGRRPKRS